MNDYSDEYCFFCGGSFKYEVPAALGEGDTEKPVCIRCLRPDCGADLEMVEAILPDGNHFAGVGWMAAALIDEIERLLRIRPGFPTSAIQIIPISSEVTGMTLMGTGSDAELIEQARHSRTLHGDDLPIKVVTSTGEISLDVIDAVDELGAKE